MIVIACDHAAVELKDAIKAHLIERGEEVCDVGPYSSESVDYSDFALKACEKVTSGAAKFGILICGTGIGMSISANKIKGIRCALCGDTFSARMTRLHNDANVLALGARVTGPGLILDIVDAFVSTGFSGDERHQRRIDKVMAIEKGQK